MCIREADACVKRLLLCNFVTFCIDTTEKTWGVNSYQLALVFAEQSKARLAEGKHHDAQVNSSNCVSAGAKGTHGAFS